MKCVNPKCDKEMQHRTGKYGGFWFCPLHGTISDKGVKMLLKRPRLALEDVGKTYDANVMREVKRQTLGFGFEPTDIEEWIVDNEDAADYEEDHWMNMRPY